MDFSLTDEQRLLKESVERLLADRYSFQARQRFMDEPTGWSRALWQSYAELGLLGLPFEDKHGGIGGGPVETMIVMEAFGRALALEPFFATVVLAGGLLRRGATAPTTSSTAPRASSFMATAPTSSLSRAGLPARAAIATDWDCSWSTPMRPGYHAGPIQLSTACMPRRSPCRGCGSGRIAFWASPAKRFR
jgi:alkylation response protein AidB-like acyl-CoA dehydrogenase